MGFSSNGTVAGAMTGGRVSLLFLLFALALYQLYSSGLPAFAAICMLPVLILGLICIFRFRMAPFWALFVINYVIQWKNITLPVPMSLPNEMLEMLLLALAIIDVKDAKFERTANIMCGALVVWSAFCTLQILNNSCGLGLQIGSWYQGARLMAFQLLYAHLVFVLYVSNPKILMRYLVIWGAFAAFAAIWIWKQQNIGLTSAENAFLQGRGRTTHIINGGATIRLFSIFGDAANYGVNTAVTAAAFLVFGINVKVKKYKYFFLTTGLLCAWATLPTGTRTATFVLFAGILAYVFLSKSFKIAIPVSIFAIMVYVILAFTDIGNGNAQIRRMRSGFNKDDASMGVREMNQALIKKYLRDAPWGIGLGMGMDNVPANNKFRKAATIPPDSEYVFIWVRTGYIGLTVFLVTTAIMFAGAAWIVLFRLRSPSLRGIGAGLASAFVAGQLGGYANQVLMQFPNCLIFYGGLSIVFILPHIEDEWIAYEKELLEKEAEKQRLKLEKKRASRV